MVFGAMIAGVYMLKQRTRCLPEPNPAWCDRCPGYTPLHEPPPRETIGQRTRPPLLPGSAQVAPRRHLSRSCGNKSKTHLHEYIYSNASLKRWRLRHGLRLVPPISCSLINPSSSIFANPGYSRVSGSSMSLHCVKPQSTAAFSDQHDVARPGTSCPRAAISWAKCT